ncbi:MAG TPA: methyltransferase domain-containing protein [Candidatus Spyradosoma merdigallinarum]|uniref:Methyltransferase domain-containing protein n=1 Tax=Candidatus Spyradosoma merdigallinarum TaxID=2840950 RepID=A0A9D1NJR1_9BACT|nr:methyltransferase domain-containing protein [Candidatus Spyradosoma merdigallinarum]
MMRQEQTSRLNFNRRAATYAENAAVQLRAAKWLGAWIERGLPDSVRIWELGAGTGFFTRELVARGCRVLATDLAPEMVAHGRRACPQAEWAICDGWNLPENACDRLYSSSLLQWMPCPEKTLRAFHAALRPGGKMLHGFFVAPSLRELYSLVPAESLPLKWRTADAWLEAFRAAGFEVLRAGTSSEVVEYADAAQLLKTLRDSGTTDDSRRVPAGALRRVLREYADRFSRENGRVVATWRVLRVEALRI